MIKDPTAETGNQAIDLLLLQYPRPDLNRRRRLERNARHFSIWSGSVPCWSALSGTTSGCKHHSVVAHIEVELDAGPCGGHPDGLRQLRLGETAAGPVADDADGNLAGKGSLRVAAAPGVDRRRGRRSNAGTRAQGRAPPSLPRSGRPLSGTRSTTSSCSLAIAWSNVASREPRARASWAR
jgi:hypothetical protein